MYQVPGMFGFVPEEPDDTASSSNSGQQTLPSKVKKEKSQTQQRQVCPACGRPMRREEPDPSELMPRPGANTLAMLADFLFNKGHGNMYNAFVDGFAKSRRAKLMR